MTKMADLGIVAPDRLGVVQFIHPGKEQDRIRNGFCSWNRAVRAEGAWPHRRKFVIGDASYIDQGEKGRGIVGFWGEWEGPSYVTASPTKAPNGLPSFFHIPAYYEPTDYTGHLDTDPFVFGERFLYNGCQQHTAHNRPGGAVPTFLKKLKVGSVILFGSALQRRFYLDTVFVVGDYTPYVRGVYDTIADKVPDEYYAITLHPQDLGNQTVKDFRLYEGATYKNQVGKMFSFTPCIPMERGASFARPAINIEGIVTQNMTQGKKFSPQSSLKSVRDVWLEVYRQVEASGCAIAHRIDLEPKPCREWQG